MIVSLVPPADADVVAIYETYRLDREPDSPQTPFQDLPASDQQAVVARLKATQFLIRVDGRMVGFVSPTVQPGQMLNLGFGLFAELRGQGLMARVLPVILQQLRQIYPEQQLVASTRLANQAAMKTLTRAGFRPTTVVLMPPIGAYHDPIPYQQFIYDPEDAAFK
jgi:RimJ/RimL family protein N-acetyltransferase